MTDKREQSQGSDTPGPEGDNQDAHHARVNPRWPNSRIWKEEERREHLQTRNRIIKDAGLVPDE